MVKALYQEAGVNPIGRGDGGRNDSTLNYRGINDTAQAPSPRLGRWSLIAGALGSLILLIDFGEGGLATFPNAALRLQAILAGCAVILGGWAIATSPRKNVPLALIAITLGVANLAYVFLIPRIIRN